MSRTGLEHKAVEAATRTTSDLGEFAAIAATYDVDRVNDRIRFGAFAITSAGWQQSGKRVPLHRDHRGEASNVIGSVDDSQVAREAWRSMRDDRVSLSLATSPSIAASARTSPTCSSWTSSRSASSLRRPTRTHGSLR